MCRKVLILIANYVSVLAFKHAHTLNSTRMSFLYYVACLRTLEKKV